MSKKKNRPAVSSVSFERVGKTTSRVKIVLEFDTIFDNEEEIKDDMSTMVEKFSL